LSRTDPSGNLSFGQVLGLAIGIAFAVVSQQYWAANALWASFATAVGGGFASAFVATGSLRAGLWGALSAAVFWGIGTGFSQTRTVGTGTAMKTIREASGASIAKAAAHAAAGGTLNVLQGGKFGHGFLSAGVSEALSPAIGTASSGGGAGGVVAGTVASAVVGGTVSELSGGKFGNGAQTGAFQYLFNQVVHGGSSPRDWTDEQWTEWRRQDSKEFLSWAVLKPLEYGLTAAAGFGAGMLVERSALWAFGAWRGVPGAIPAMLRVRHHTSSESLASIRQQGAINPSRGGGVHVETQPFGPPQTASTDTGAFGRGGYVEFNAPISIVPTNVGPRTTAMIPATTPLPISGTNPTFRAISWWRF